MALTTDGTVWICDPYYVGNDFAEVLFGTEVAGEPTTACTDNSDLSTCTVTDTVVTKNLVPGCMQTSPQAVDGGDFWYTLESQTFFELGEFVDAEDFVACPFMDNWMYSWGDMVVGSDDIVYECWDLEYCSWEPTSELGSYGWYESIFDLTDIPAYDADTNADLAVCQADKHYVITTGMTTLPYRTGDVLVWGISEIANGIT